MLHRKNGKTGVTTTENQAPLKVTMERDIGIQGKRALCISLFVCFCLFHFLNHLSFLNVCMWKP